MKEDMHQKFVTMSEQLSCTMQDKLQYRPPTQEFGHDQTGYWCTNCGQHGHIVVKYYSRRSNIPPRQKYHGENFNNAGLVEGGSRIIEVWRLVQNVQITIGFILRINATNWIR